MRLVSIVAALVLVALGVLRMPSREFSQQVLTAEDLVYSTREAVAELQKRGRSEVPSLAVLQVKEKIPGTDESRTGLKVVQLSEAKSSVDECAQRVAADPIRRTLGADTLCPHYEEATAVLAEARQASATIEAAHDANAFSRWTVILAAAIAAVCLLWPPTPSTQDWEREEREQLRKTLSASGLVALLAGVGCLGLGGLAFAQYGDIALNNLKDPVVVAVPLLTALLLASSSFRIRAARSAV